MTQDWNPETYARFRGLRLRPALDLLGQVADLPPGDIVDLGCGNGAVGPALARRWPGRRLIGVDTSPAMLEKATRAACYTRLEQADAAQWVPLVPPALIFSNALCQWLPDHGTLFPKLAALLVPGGALAVQMPGQTGAPSHALMRQIAGQMFPGRFDFSSWRAPVAAPAAYARMLAPLGAVTAWETSYVQALDPVADGHPVRHFTESTALRPFAARLTQPELADFLRAYEAALSAAYPPEADGGVLFPFRRVFFVLAVPG